jgi:hypothetical protein
MRIQRLELRPRELADRFGKTPIAWINVTKPKRREAVAEKIAINARTDWQNANTLIRVR